MSFHRRVISLALFSMSAGFSLPAGADEGPSTETRVAIAPQSPSVSVVTAQIRELVSNLVVTGTLVPRETVSVGAEVDGLRIEELLADEGDRVETGAVLARLSTELTTISLAQKDSQVKRAEAAMAQADSQIAEALSSVTEAEAALARSVPLQQKGIVGQDVLDQRVATASAARAKLASARQGLTVAEADRTLALAQRRELEWRLSKAEIKAPAAGLVLSRAARIGAVASASSGSLFEIARDSLIELDAAVSETVLPSLSPGQKVTVSLAGGTQSLDGTVRLVSPQVDQTTRLGQVKIALPASDRVHSGSFARGIVELARSRGVVVPQTAVVTGAKKSVVQVVSNGRIETRTVKLGISTGSEVEIVDGLAAGDDVVAIAGSFVRDGDAVTPIHTAPEAKG